MYMYKSKFLPVQTCVVVVAAVCLGLKCVLDMDTIYVPCPLHDHEDTPLISFNLRILPLAPSVPSTYNRSKQAYKSPSSDRRTPPSGCP